MQPRSSVFDIFIQYSPYELITLINQRSLHISLPVSGSLPSFHVGLRGLFQDLKKLFLGSELALVVAVVVTDPVARDGGGQNVLRESERVDQRQRVGRQLCADAAVQVEDL